MIIYFLLVAVLIAIICKKHKESELILVHKPETLAKANRVEETAYLDYLHRMGEIYANQWLTQKKLTYRTQCTVSDNKFFIGFYINNVHKTVISFNLHYKDVNESKIKEMMDSIEHILREREMEY
jgi:hypothetical protein